MVKPRWTPVGVDLGDFVLRAAQLRRVRGGHEVAVLGHGEAGSMGEEPGARLEAGVRRLLRDFPFRGRRMVAAMNPPEVEFHVLELPDAALEAGGERAEELVRWEIGRLTGEPVQRVETRHWRLPSRAAGLSGAIGVSAPREAVERLVGGLKRAGAVCGRVTPCAVALHQLGRRLRVWAEDEVWGVLDLGARQSRLTLSVGGAPVLIRNTGSGGRAWTQRIAQILKISPAAAEIQKKAHGIALAGRRESQRGAGGDVHGEIAGMILGALRADLSELAAEVRRSYEYVLSSYPGRRAGDLVLVGGGAGLINLPEFFASILGISVKRASEYLGREGCRVGLGQDCLARPADVDAHAAALGLAIGNDGG